MKSSQECSEEKFESRICQPARNLFHLCCLSVSYLRKTAKLTFIYINFTYIFTQRILYIHIYKNILRATVGLQKYPPHIYLVSSHAVSLC